MFGRWWWWSWVGQQVCGPGSCGEESGLPRLASLAGASCPQWLCLARFLLAGEGGKLHTMMRLCSDGVGEELLLEVLYFSAISCYIHCYIAACVLFAVCLDHAGVFNARLLASSLPSSLSAHHHPALAAGTADLRKPNSDSCRYEPLMSVAHKKTCTPSQPPPFPWYSVPRLLTTTGPPAACHLASPRP